jgi:Flp pilus assembly pilin Flp
MKKLRELYEKIGSRLAVVWSEKGQTTIEYILVIVLIVLVLVLAVSTSLLSQAVGTAVNKIVNALT